ncbi:MAG: hypothetical protein JW870_04940 [Candidatus Delongbacteria bacterium]|nr:hypothetical protein [Candidatus Delongbacteria bacterium]
MKKENKNLKHGYIFLSGTVVLLFLACLSTEIYFKGGFNFTRQKIINGSLEIDQKSNVSDINLIIQNLTDGFKTQDENITIVGVSDKGNEISINGQKVNINENGKFEFKFSLIIGTNQIIVIAKNNEGNEKQLALNVIREERPQQVVAEKIEIVDKPKQEIQKPIQKQDEKQEETKTEPIEPVIPSPITGLKINCSITNTQPFIGQTVEISCSVKDQNNSPVNGAFGYATLNWQSGTTVYTLNQSDASGTMRINFTVPANNNGAVQGSIKVSKDGLNVSSNFTLIVQ